MRKGAFRMAEAFAFVLTVILFSNLSTILSQDIMMILNIIFSIIIYLIPQSFITTQIMSVIIGFVVYLVLDTVFDILTKKLKP